MERERRGMEWRFLGWGDFDIYLFRTLFVGQHGRGNAGVFFSKCGAEMLDVLWMKKRAF